MPTNQVRNWIRFLSFVLSFVLVLVITGCAGATPTPAPTATLIPTPVSTATPVPKPPPAVILNVTPGPQVAIGQGVAIVIKVEPYEKLEWKWSVTGTGGGQLNSTMGEQVVYTAGSKEGVDIVVVEAKTASGTTIKQTVALTSVASPTAMPVAPIVTPRPSIPPTATPSVGVTLTNLQSDQKVPCETIARGTYPLDLKEYIWPVVYINGRYHPQDEAGKAASKVGGNWYQTIRFGDCTRPPEYDRGKPFQLIVVTANDSANAEFERYIKAGQSTNAWPGLIELPPGIKEHVRIVVIRQ